MKLPSASAMERAMLCPASAVLPKVRSVSEPAARGTALHAYFANLQRMTRDEALALVEPEHRPACEAVDVESLPIGAEWGSELAVVYDVEAETTRVLGKDIGRDYGTLADTEVPMTIDLAGHRAGLVFAADFKTGRGRVTSAKQNWQLRVAAVAMAALKGEEAARVAVIHTPDGGDVWYDVAELDAFDLAMFREELRALRRRLLAGEAKPVVGEHCRYCDSFTYCSAQTAIVRRMAGDPEHVGADIAELLTPETAARAYERLKLVKAVTTRVEAALRMYAEENPISLPDGSVFGPVVIEREEVDASVARAVLAEMYGGEVAEKACDFETSKAAIERAVRVVYEQRKQAGEKVTISGLKEKALEAIRERDGIRVKARKETKEHRG